MVNIISHQSRVITGFIVIYSHLNQNNNLYDSKCGNFELKNQKKSKNTKNTEKSTKFEIAWPLKRGDYLC
jgi:hypothetical protein